MMIVKKILRILVLFCILTGSGLWRCSVDNLAGGSTEDGNSSAVAGVILNSDGSAGSRVQVFLIPKTYNPGKDAIIPDVRIDTTNASGEYTFIVKDTGVYNIEAVHLSQRTRLFIPNITVAGDSIEVPDGTLEKPGAAFVFLPDTVDTIGGYLFIPGTTLFKKITSDNSFTQNGKTVIIFDSLTPGMIPGLYYSTEQSLKPPELLTNTGLYIPSEDTVNIDAFNFWNVYTVKNSGLTDDYVTALAMDQDGVLWVGTYSGDVLRFDGSVWQVCLVGDVLSDSRITSLLCDNSGIVWAGTSEEGLKRYDGISWENFDSFNGALLDDYVAEITEDVDGTKWIATDFGLVHLTVTGSEFYTSWDSDLPDDMVQTVAIDSRGIKWVGTSNGIASFDDTLWSVYTSQNSNLPDDNIAAVAIDGSDTKWIVTFMGLTSLKGQQFTVYQNENIDMPIFSMAVDEKGNKWMGLMGFSLLAQFNENGWTTHHFYNFDNEEAPYMGVIVDIEVHEENGLLYAATNGGLIEFQLP